MVFRILTRPKRLSSASTSVHGAISVDVRAMQEVLRKVFGAHEIADELTKG